MRTASISAVVAVLTGMALPAAPSAQQVDSPRSGQLAAAPSGVQPVEQMPRYLDEDSASQTRERFPGGSFGQYPPSLAEVIRLDPSLLTDERYLAPTGATTCFESPRTSSAIVSVALAWI